MNNDELTSEISVQSSMKEEKINTVRHEITLESENLREYWRDIGSHVLLISNT